MSSPTFRLHDAIIRSLILYLLLAKSTTTLAQQYIFKNYSVEDGVAQSQVYTLLQDSRGYIWMGTRGGGITKFDGLHFTTYTQKQGLCNNYVSKIKEDRKHNLWIATNNGLCVYDGIRFTHYDLSPYQEIAIYDFAFGDKDQIMLATEKGMYCFENGHFTNILNACAKREEAYMTVCRVDTEWWCGNTNGITRFTCNKNQWTCNHTKLSFPQPISVNTLTTDERGRVWIGTYANGVWYYEKNKLIQTSLTTQNILNIYFDRNQNVWFATLNEGVYAINLISSGVNHITETEGLSNNHVRSIIQDNAGNYWFGTSGGGICHYFGKQFVHFDTQSGLGGNFIYSIYRDQKKRLWIGNSDKGTTLLDSNRFIKMNAENGFANVKVKAMIEDLAGHMFLGTDGNGVFMYRDSTFIKIESFNNCYVRGFDKDTEGNIWMATAGNGLYKNIAR